MKMDEIIKGKSKLLYQKGRVTRRANVKERTATREQTEPEKALAWLQ